MSAGQSLARFYPSSRFDFFKCLKLAEKIQREKNENNSQIISKNRISYLKRSLDISEFENDGNITLAEAENFAREKKFRLRIWKQKTYRHPLFLEFESKFCNHDGEIFPDLDLFRHRASNKTFLRTLN